MQPTPFGAAAVDRFLAEVSAADGHPPLSGHKLSQIAQETGRVDAWSDDEGVCLVCVAAHHAGDGHWAIEAAVATRRRDATDEEAAIRNAERLVPNDDRHTLWAFRGEQIEAAIRLGYVETRSVLRMSVAIADVARVPASGISITSMIEEDVAAIVEINNRAFVGHREQAAMTVDSFRRLIRSEGFDADGTVVARTEQRIAGFCVTKRQGSVGGEVYLLAVDPDLAGSGYGSMLASAGCDRLANRGAATAVVWVDTTNHAALRVYRALGFSDDFRNREMTPATD